MPHDMPSVTWHQARDRLYSAARTLTPPLHQEILPLRDCLGRHAAQDLTALMPVPHYTSSAMDGYAVAGPPPWRIITPEYPEDTRANIHRLATPLASGEATPILTGGLLPEGAEAIVREEHASITEGSPTPEGTDRCLNMAPGKPIPAAGSDIRVQGTELQPGDTLSTRGEVITPRLAAFLGVNGFDQLPVLQRVSVRCALTGNEVITSGLPEPGQVRDAFGGFLEPTLTAAGCKVHPSIRLPDRLEDFRDFVQNSRARVLILTGGSSTSSADLVRTLLTELEADYLFEAVQVHPGHPALAAKIPSASEDAPTGQERLVLGLPGNPLAAYSALYSYLPPVLAGLRRLPFPELEHAELAAEIAPARKKSVHRLLPVQVREGLAYPLRATASHMLSGLAHATHLALVDAPGQRAGTRVALVPVF